MKDFLSLAKERFSARSFSSKPVSQEKIDYILQAAQIAPTAKNIQPIKIYLLRSSDALNKAQKVSPCIYNSQCVFMICSDSTAYYNEVNGRYSSQIDAGIVCTHMMLAAADLGLGSCWVGNFDSNLTHEIFSLPDDITVWCLLDVGYVTDDCVPADRHTLRKSLSELVTEL